VKYWGLGNELDGPWQLGHKNADDYSKFALEAAKAMRRVDDSIKLIASGSSNFRVGADWVGWNRTVLDYLKNDIDYISLHTYTGNQANDLERFLATGEDVDQRIEVVEGLHPGGASDASESRTIKIAYDEWNVWYRARSNAGEFATARRSWKKSTTLKTPWRWACSSTRFSAMPIASSWRTWRSW